jgi:hypothetical protein
MFSTDSLIYIVMTAFGAMGLGALVAPEKVTLQFGIPQLTSAGRNEVRAVYGGFGLMMSVMLLVAVNHIEFKSGICLTLSAALSGMVIGRIISFCIERKIDAIPLLYLILELVFAVMLVMAL